MKKLFVMLLAVSLGSSCKKSVVNPDHKYYAAANINEKEWRYDDLPTAQLEYNRYKEFHELWVYAGSVELDDGNSYELKLHVGYPASTGKFYLTKTQSGAGADWASGSVTVRRGDTGYITATSINGFIDITHLTREDMKGTFEYTAVTNWSSTHAGGDTIKVENGEFHLMLIGGHSSTWEGPK